MFMNLCDPKDVMQLENLGDILKYLDDEIDETK